MREIIFYTNPQSRGLIVHWLLEELGIPYETQWLDYGEQMKGAKYLAINPMGKVPAIRHNSAVITEAAAICAYLAASYPEKGLIPNVGDPKLADFYRWMMFAAGPMEMAVTAHTSGWEVAAERRGQLGFGSYDDTLAALEIAIAGQPFICGDKFTAADIYFGSGLQWGMVFGAIEKRASFEEYVNRLQARPAAQRSVKINEDRVNSLAQ